MKMTGRLLIIVLAARLHPQVSVAQDSAPAFQDSTQSAALTFQHISPSSPERHVHLTMGSGVAICDFDRDGCPDLYFAQGGAWSGTINSATTSKDQLLRNRRGHFVDVSTNTELASGSYGMGVAVGDSNNDGFPDVYVSRFGTDILLQNNGDGTFQLSESLLPPSTSSYSASCTWTDVNADGTPDMFVTRYVNISDDNYPVCTDDATNLAAVCPPWTFDGLHDVLLLGDGAGRLVDVSEERGLQGVKPAQGLAAVTSDLDDDGDLDIYVANDSVPNHFWKNDGKGVFSEAGLITGLAVNRDGRREAGMGLAIGDATSSGRVDLVVTNFHEETNTFYRNEGFGFFNDVTDEIGVGAPSRSHLAFGINFLDADGDSDLDLFVANGHIHDRLKELGRDIPYRQSPQLLTMNNGRYEDVSERSGTVFTESFLGRGSAVLDFNKDGKTDVLMTNLGGRPVLFDNQTMGHGRVLTLHLSGRVRSRDAVGARVTVTINGRNPIVRFIDGSSSYLSTSESVARFGVGNSDVVDEVTVRWPNGESQSWKDIPSNATYSVVESVSRIFSLP